MADFGLVIFEDAKIKRKDANSKVRNLALKLSEKFIGLLFNAGFFKSRFGTKLYFSYRKDDFKNGLSSFELLESLKAWVIKLPFTVATLFHLNMKYIIEYLERLCTEKGIRDCLLPEPIRDRVCRDGFHNCPHSFCNNRALGKVILKSLLVSVLEEVYPKLGKRIENIDIAIVSGNDNEEVLTIVRILEPYINFITIVAADKADIESELSELFADSGLSFSVSSEYRNQLKHADLIINLGKLLDISRYRMSKKALLINLFESVESGIPGENAVLNDIVFEIAGTYMKNLIYELHGYYSKAEIYEIVMMNKLGLDAYDKFTFELAEYIQREFRKAGCRITGFVGRRGIISIDSVIKTISG